MSDLLMSDVLKFAVVLGRSGLSERGRHPLRLVPGAKHYAETNDIVVGTEGQTAVLTAGAKQIADSTLVTAASAKHNKSSIEIKQYKSR